MRDSGKKNFSSVWKTYSYLPKQFHFKIIDESLEFHDFDKHGTDGRTHGRTDTPFYRDA